MSEHSEKNYGGLPSVTEILRDVGIIPPIHPAAADNIATGMERGTDVHLATALDDENNLDEESIAPEYMPYLAQWRDFKKEKGAIIWTENGKAERKLISARYQFGGTLDRLATIGKDVFLIDIKTGKPSDWVEVQLAGYAILCREHDLGGKRMLRAAVGLDGKGKYKFRPIDKNQYQKHENEFLSALVVYNRKHRR